MEMRDPFATSVDRRRARKALSAGRRAYALHLRSAGATYAQIGVALGLSSTRVGQLLAKAERLAAQPRWHGQFPARALNFLIIRGLADLPELEAALAVAKLTREQIKAEPNFGPGALAAIEAWLAGIRLALRDEPITESKTGASARKRPSDSDFNSSSPLAAGHREAPICAPKIPTLAP